MLGLGGADELDDGAIHGRGDSVLLAQPHDLAIEVVDFGEAASLEVIEHG